VNNDIKWGLILLLGGGAITLYTYESAANGGSYFIMWGVMIYGGYRLILGLFDSVSK
jgi:hypothetical protein